jgi:hypothetical protein
MAMTPLTSEQKAQASRLLRFEWEMLLATDRGLNESRERFASLDEAELGLPTALLESFASHVRNLVTFLYTHRRDGKAKTRRPDDVNAEDLIKSWAEKETATVENARVQANKQVSYIGMDRLGLPNAGAAWPYEAIKMELGATLDRFLRASPTECRGPWNDYLHGTETFEYAKLNGVFMLLAPMANTAAFVHRTDLAKTTRL